MYCSKCGYKLPDDALFCASCGKKVERLNLVENATVNVGSGEDAFEVKVEERVTPVHNIIDDNAVKGSYYELLGISVNATTEEISNAYKKLRKKYQFLVNSPDAMKQFEAKEKIELLDKAKKILCDEVARADYDKTLAERTFVNEQDNETRAAQPEFNEKQNEQKVTEERVVTEQIKQKNTVQQQVERKIDYRISDKPEYYFITDVDKLWALYTRYKETGDKYNEKMCFRKLQYLAIDDKRVINVIKQYDRHDFRKKLISWGLVFASALVMSVFLTGVDKLGGNTRSESNYNANNSQAISQQSNSADTNQVVNNYQTNTPAQPLPPQPIPPTPPQPALPQTFQNITPAGVVNAQHSSADKEGSYIHSASLAIDGNTQTCWSEGAPGLGIGENIVINFNGTYTVRGMNIWIGHQKTLDLFYQNARPAVIRVIGSDGSNEMYNLKDSFGAQQINFKKPINVQNIKLVIETATPGNKYKDTCIAEVSFF